MSKTWHNLPENLNPEGDKCYPLSIPDDPQWRQYVTRALRVLTLDRHWERDDDKSALIVREVFDTRMYQPFIEALYAGTPCDFDTLGECYRLDTATEAFSFYPNDPFISAASEDPVVLGMTWRRWENTDVENTAIWQTIDDIFNSLTGYYPNDCMIFPTELVSFAFSSWLDLVEYFTLQVFPFPYVHFELEGHGQFEIELVNVPFGGSALIVPDADILSWQGILDVIIEFIDLDGELPPGWVFTEVDRDISIPPETAATQTQEIEFEEEGTHSVTVVFIPRLDDELPFFFPFGGIREIEVCGNLNIIGSQTGEQINKENAGLSQHIRQGVIPMGTTEEFYDALIRYETEKANRWLLASSPENIENDVEISKNTGSITIKQALGGGGAVDGTTQELHFGGVYNQAVQFKKLFDDMNANIDSAYAVDTVVNLARLFANPADLGAWTTLVGDYFTADPEIVIDADELALQMFCHGYSNGALAYALNEHGSVEADVNTIIDFVADIPSSTWDSWYSTGKSAPKDGFIAAPCYRYPSTSVLLTTLDKVTTQIAYGLAYPGIGTRNYRIETSGYFLGTNGERVNAVHKVDEFGVITRHDWQNFEFHGPASFERSVEIPTLPAYNASGVYAWTIEVPSGFFDWVNYRAQSVAWIDETFTGNIQMTVHDLGAP